MPGDTVWDDAAFTVALERAATGVIAAHGVRLSTRQLGALLKAAPRDSENPQRFLLTNVDFSGASFSGNIRFDGAIFSGAADFRGATFSGNAEFTGAIFRGNACFGRARFRGNACFGRARFGGKAWFEPATFEHDADFRATTWTGEARFIVPTSKKVLFDGAIFARRARLVVCADYLSAVGTEFRAATDIRAMSATITLEEAIFAAPSMIGPAIDEFQPEKSPTSTKESATSTSEPIPTPTESPISPSVPTIPTVRSLRGARITDLTLWGVDLRTCRFSGAHGLASVRLEQVLFAEPPDGWRKPRRRPLSGIWWTRRAAIAEEHRWRAHKRFPGWEEPRDEEQPIPTPHQIAAVYRALRKGREDNNDEPGAGDFYYGEMEMRRHSNYETPPREAPSIEKWTEYDDTRRTSRAEKRVLWLYWLVSGYGLRASRALLALAVTIAVLAIPLHFWGFRPDRPYGRALLFSLESSISLLRAPEAKLTASGEAFQSLLRLAGPLFFGLALLAFRGRVKR